MAARTLPACHRIATSMSNGRLTPLVAGSRRQGVPRPSRSSTRPHRRRSIRPIKGSAAGGVPAETIRYKVASSPSLHPAGIDSVQSLQCSDSSSPQHGARPAKSGRAGSAKPSSGKTPARTGEPAPSRPSSPAATPPRPPRSRFRGAPPRPRTPPLPSSSSSANAFGPGARPDPTNLARSPVLRGRPSCPLARFAPSLFRSRRVFHPPRNTKGRLRRGPKPPFFRPVSARL